MSNWNKKPDDEKIYRWTEFFHKLDNNKSKCTRAHVQENKSIYLSKYLSVWKPFWKRVYIYLYIHIYIYLCDFSKRCTLSFRLNTGISSQCSRKKNRGLAVLLGVSRESRPRPTRGWVADLFCVKTRGVRRGDFVTLNTVSCQKAVQSQINAVTHNHNTASRDRGKWLTSHKLHDWGGWVVAPWTWLSGDSVQAPCNI